MRFPKRKLIRALEDDQVDRAGVEVQQCTKLTATNSPFGLTIKYTLYTDFPLLKQFVDRPSNISKTRSSNDFG
jgi:hypothetical protein